MASRTMRVGAMVAGAGTALGLVVGAAALAAVRRVDDATCGDTPRGVHVRRTRAGNEATSDTAPTGYY